jgi:hypothetical protein
VTTQPAPKKTRKRLPPTTEMGRQLMKAGRERMAEEAARTAEAMLTERKARAEWEESLNNRSVGIPERAAVQRGLLNSIVGSLASENITPFIDVLPTMEDMRLEAWTDFKRIHVRYHTDPDPRVMAAVLRGLMYHEGGHIRWTIPFPELRTMVCDRDDRTGVELRKLQRAWNALEDQRMETAVVSDSPRKAAFFVPMVLCELLNTVDKATGNYPLLVWRRYLPKHIRTACREAFVARFSEALTQDIEVCVDRYVKATTPREMWNAVAWFADLTEQLQLTLPEAAETHRFQTSTTPETGEQRGPDSSEKMSIPVDPTMDADEDEDEDEEAGEAIGSAPQDDEDEAGEDEGAGAGSEGDEEGDQDVPAGAGGEEGEEAGEGDDDGDSDLDGDETSDDGSSQGAEGHGAGARSEEEADHSLTQDDLNEAIAKAEEDRYNDRALDADVDAYNDALDRRGSKLMPYELIPDTNADHMIAAEALADDLVGSFNQATMDRMPAWVEGQRSGILNVGRYMTRQPGDMEFFKQWVDDDVPGYNLAVSVLLDYSGSMSSNRLDLARVGYATKKACDRLEIPCTVVLWDDDAKVLWDGEEEAGDVLPTISCTGNTDPSWALADLDNQRFGKVRHLVLIMTDGVWAGFGGRTLAPYAADGRILMGVGYAPGNPTKANARTDKLRTYGCPDAFPVTNLEELPWLLEGLLLQMA